MTGLRPQSGRLRPADWHTTQNKVKQHALSGAFSSGFALSLMAKDVSIADALARSVGVRAPLTRKTRDLWRAAERKLRAGADHTETFRYLEPVLDKKKL